MYIYLIELYMYINLLLIVDQEYRARRIAIEPCCHRQCMLMHGSQFGFIVARHCLDELFGLNSREKKQYLLDKLSGCMTGISNKGYAQITFTVGTGVATQMSNVCRHCFCNCYQIGHTYLDALCAAVKAGNRVVALELSDSTPTIASPFIKNLIALAASYDIHLSPTQLGSLQVPNTVASLTCFSWLQSFFQAVGDKEPNRDEIHLEPTDIKSVHAEYRQAVADTGEEVLAYTTFLNLWVTCFPHVRIREFKAVTGKCKTCAVLSEARRKQLSYAGCRYLTELHSLHRTMYMGERLTYYERRDRACRTPSEFWSAIGDGMMTQHSVLPHRGNMVQFPHTLPQHFQGMLVHGRSIEMYRTFHNVPNNGNLSIHCLLLALEKVKRDEGRIPDVLYYQIDGGPENTGNAVLGIAELIVLRGLAKQVVLTRLPVGHTHEDIDAKFAVVWMRVRNQFVLSPIQYATLVERALTTSTLKCTVIDIFIVPDYVAYILPYVDKKLGR